MLSYHSIVSCNLKIKDETDKQLFEAIGKSSDDFNYSFDSEIRVTMCFSSKKAEDIGISFRYQLGNEMKPIRKGTREEFVTSSLHENT